jgi:hypothetical protein
LEISSPGIEPERLNGSLRTLVEDVALELGIEVINGGSMTYRREDLERGFEPDSSFYIEQAVAMRDKWEIDSSIDPPPDLVIEVEATRSAIAKMPIYVRSASPRFGVVTASKSPFSCWSTGNTARFPRAAPCHRSRRTYSVGCSRRAGRNLALPGARWYETGREGNAQRPDDLPLHGARDRRGDDRQRQQGVRHDQH